MIKPLLLFKLPPDSFLQFADDIPELAVLNELNMMEIQPIYDEIDRQVAELNQVMIYRKWKIEKQN